MNNLLHVKERKNLSTKTVLAQRTVRAMAALLVTVPPLYRVIGKTVPPGESQVMNGIDWGYV